MESPVFSLITVCYNAESVIERTLQSVCAQDYPKIEYIVVDGASKDGTMDIVARYPVSRVLSEPDHGLYEAMNKGLALATGDYVCFLNAGDAFHQPDTLSRMAASLPQGDWPGVLYGQTALVDEQGRFVGMRRLSAPEHLTWKSFRRGMVVCHQAFFALRRLCEPYDLSYRVSADVDWCIRVMKKSEVLWNTHLTIVDYLNEGISTRHRKASWMERFRILRRHYGLLSAVASHVWFVLRLPFK